MSAPRDVARRLAVPAGLALVLAVAPAGCRGDDPGESPRSDGGATPSANGTGGGTGSGTDGETGGTSFSTGEQLPDQQSGVILGAAFAGGLVNDFGTVPVGGSRSTFVQVRTTFDLLPFQVTTVSVSGPFFVLVDAATCQGVLLTEEAPDCVVEVLYAPESTGLHEGQFSVTGVTAPAETATAAPQQRTTSLRLQGSGG